MTESSPASFAPSRHDDTDASYREPLSRGWRLGLLALVISFHVGIGWALSEIEPARLVVGEAPPMEVRMVAADPPPAPQINIPVPEDTPPPEIEPELESMIQPPPQDLPPPVFPVQAPPPPPKPKPLPPKLHPQQAAQPVERAPQAAAAPTQPPGPKTVSSSQVSFLVKPSPVYPAHSRRVNEQGVATVRVLIDATGRPTQVSLQSSSGHAALDQSALSAVKAAQFRPYIEGGIPQSVWVLVPINFVLQ